MSDFCLSDIADMTLGGRVTSGRTRGRTKASIGRRMKKPLLANEPIRLMIQRANKLHADCPLSQTVLIIDQDGKRTQKIKFHVSNTLQLIGGLMPQGIANFKPAYLKVVWRSHKQVYDVVCCYLDRSACILLWQTEELPKWAQPIGRTTRPATL